MIRDLTDFAVNLVKAEKTEEVQAKAEDLAEEKILDILIPPVRRPQRPIQQTQPPTAELPQMQPEQDTVSEEYQNQKTRSG